MQFQCATKMKTLMNIDLAISSDHHRIWDLCAKIIAKGDTYMFDTKMQKSDFLRYWFDKSLSTYLCEQDGRLLGAYVLKPNQMGPGNHFAHCSYMVGLESKGLGVDKLLFSDDIWQAHEQGCPGIQFIVVVVQIQGHQTLEKVWL